MKNKIPKESMFKKKGFYVALYSCLGAVMVMAAVVSYGNLSAVNKPGGQANTGQSPDYGQMEMTSLGSGKSIQSEMSEEAYLTPSDQFTAVSPKPASTPKPAAMSTPKPATTPSSKPVTGTQEQKPNSAPANEQAKPGVNEQAAPGAKPDSEEKKPPAQSTSQLEDSSSDAANNGTAQDPYAYDEVMTGVLDTEPVFNMFTDDSKMSWPVFGEVVMDFSNDHAVYDKTLDQYRTNDTLCIAADLGSQVVASADGEVETVTKTKEDGNMVVINHGNGWLTTYSQLQDGVLVKEGDVVNRGQIIGGVASPSIYSVLLGNHIGFKVTKDDALINPNSILE